VIRARWLRGDSAGGEQRGIVGPSIFDLNEIVDHLHRLLRLVGEDVEIIMPPDRGAAVQQPISSIRPPFFGPAVHSACVSFDKSIVPRTTRKNPLKRRLKTRTAAAGVVGIVVRRGAQRRFAALIQKTADLPAVVTWDRRQADRRASAQPAPIDQRKSERRGKPPYTWEVADFVVVERPALEPAAGPRRAKPATPEA
jgi:hypothetical protein